MTEELTTRGPFDSDPGVLVRWMLKSGQRTERHIGQHTRTEVRGGIQLYVPSGGQIVELDFKDVHEAGDLYVALEAHMENVATDATMEARTMTQEEREAITPNVPAVIPADYRESNLKAFQEEIDHPLLEDRRPRLVKADGEEYTGPRVIVPSDEYRDLLAASSSAAAAAAGIDAEFLGAMADVVEAWTSYTPAAREAIAATGPVLAAALDRLAALNA